MTRSKAVFVVLFVVLLAGAGWLFMGRGLTRSGRPSVILISLDTCRADHLSCYSGSGKTTPYIDAFARQAVLFSNVLSPVPLTLPAHCSMLTGTIPPYHGVHDNSGYRLGDSMVTLAELLRDRGYATAAVIGASVLESQTGMDQGFQTYDDHLSEGLAASGGRPERRAEEVTRIAVSWLDEHAADPFFLFLHYFDPHHPYVPPEPFSSRFAGDPYAGEIAYTDDRIGEVLDKLKQLGVYDSSIIIITGDHGEGLGEHGEPAHGYFIYHSTTKVPLVVRLPGRSDAKRIEGPVALVDIVPTVLGQLALAGPPELQGKDLTGLLAGDVLDWTGRYRYSESMTATGYGCSSLLGVETAAWKYIQAPKPELYDLAADPGEAHNVVADQPATANRFREELRSLLAEHHRDRGEESARASDREALARLQALGYVGGSSIETFEFTTDKPDPKEFAETYFKIQQFTDLANRKRNEEARQIAAEILEVKPDIADIHARLAQIAIEQGDMDAVVRHQLEALKLDPDSPNALEWHNNLGAALSRMRRFDGAAEHYRQALRLAQARPEQAAEPGDPSVAMQRRSQAFVLHVNLAGALSMLGRFEEAVTEYRNALSISPDRAAVHQRLAAALSQLGRDDEAAEEYRKARQLDPRMGSDGG